MSRNDIESRLAPYLFPVHEDKVYVDNPETGIRETTPGYKAIVRQDTGSVISIAQNSYKLVPNAEVIKPLLKQLHRLDTSWFVDASHSFVQDERMRLQITFPELIFHDGRSDIALSLFLHNSYDGSEGVRMFWGAIRGICKNGMVFGTVLAKYYRKHTQGLDIGNLREQLEGTYQTIPVIRHRIDMLQNTSVTKDLRKNVEKALGKRITKHVEEQEKQNQKAANKWVLFNMLTWYISHVVKQHSRARYQMELSRLFGL